ncbi:MAG: mannose-1-phosphate guanylyltransferase, partial [Oscillospiraceae bacterium]
MNTTIPRVAVIMAGGKGERFWPQSRQSLPKQFLSLTADGKTLFQMTVARMKTLTSIEHIFVVTNEAYCDIITQQEPEFLPQNILCEPCAKNTAPAIAFAAAVVKKRYKDATMFVVPSDHIIHNRRLYTEIMCNAADFAESGENLVTLGITPTYPETGYGYINFSESLAPLYPNVYRVARFVEKPTLSVAEEYIDDGSFLWNSGMFIWRSSSFLEGLAK